MEISQKQTLDAGTEKSMYYQPAFLVNPSALPEKEREQMTTVISGRKCSELLTKSSRLGFAVKTLLASCRWYCPVKRLHWETTQIYSERVTYGQEPRNSTLSTELYVILKQSDMKCKHLLFRLQVSELPISETDSGSLQTLFPNRSPFYQRGTLLPTPVATDATAGAVLGKEDRFIVKPNRLPRRINKQGTNGSLGLARLMKLLPTPCASEAEKYAVTYNPETQMGQALTALALKGLLPTPQSRDHRNGSLIQGKRFQRKLNQGWTIDLNDLAVNQLLPTPTASMETVQDVIQAKYPGNNRPPYSMCCPTGMTSLLNPLYVSEMMGYPKTYLISPFLNGDGKP